ncbi:hypothetical protein U1Q18_044452 [Sarracenia purpurea var. burkii]
MKFHLSACSQAHPLSGEFNHGRLNFAMPLVSYQQRGRAHFRNSRSSLFENDHLYGVLEERVRKSGYLERRNFRPYFTRLEILRWRIPMYVGMYVSAGESLGLNSHLARSSVQFERGKGGLQIEKGGAVKLARKFGNYWQNLRRMVPGIAKGSVQLPYVDIRKGIVSRSRQAVANFPRLCAGERSGQGFEHNKRLVCETFGWFIVLLKNILGKASRECFSRVCLWVFCDAQRNEKYHNDGKVRRRRCELSIVSWKLYLAQSNDILRLVSFRVREREYAERPEEKLLRCASFVDDDYE